MPKTKPLIIEGQSIPGSFFGKLVKNLGTHGAHKALFKARHAESIVRYCTKGLEKGWITQYSIEMEYESDAMRRWIDKTFLHIDPEPVKEADKTDPQGLGDILKEII